MRIDNIPNFSKTNNTTGPCNHLQAHLNGLNDGRFGPMQQPTNNKKDTDNDYTRIGKYTQIFSVVDCCLEGQIATFGQNGPNVTTQPWRHQFWRDDNKFWPQKNTMVTTGRKVREGVKCF